ncbi:DeoR/GlpR family DNA-binding transcription regulator [Nocardioides rotundus]|uniref:DeoR/GlpR family DNA-binding transcription regulator n=1 Tax=Nocardioides rotundus TaxID=1774216 RepID=UPI001CBEFAC4|nr:DeoR/GlpR family DNA-binding transcription regulator [Nocardioides rotundus]UAL30166.1 DeoR/GlpR family DNA-binding transcription regulator [Nocardioides rotundus]
MSSTRAGTRARHAELLRLLHQGVTSVEDLAERLDVSPSTVRRDLGRLGADGTVARTYGGAMVAPFHERSVADSADRATAAKQAIARAALPLVPPDGQVFLDAGTTCGALARLIAGEPGLGDLTVVTRGLETATVLADVAHVEVHLLGGRLRRMSHGLVGPVASRSLAPYGFDRAFLGADAVDPARGIGEPTVEETTLKEQVAEASAGSVVLADASKLVPTTMPAWAVLAAPWTLVTDVADAELEARCSVAGVTLLPADAAE